MTDKPTIQPADIRWRVGATNQDKTRGMLLGYIDARTCMKALDELDGTWQDEYAIVTLDGKEGIQCRLTVAGITRSDVGMPSNQDPLKGAYSDALKRAAVKHGIGRELYDLPVVWVALNARYLPVELPRHDGDRWVISNGTVDYPESRYDDDGPTGYLQPTDEGFDEDGPTGYTETEQPTEPESRPTAASKRRAAEPSAEAPTEPMRKATVEQRRRMIWPAALKGLGYVPEDEEKALLTCAIHSWDNLNSHKEVDIAWHTLAAGASKSTERVQEAAGGGARA